MHGSNHTVNGISVGVVLDEYNFQKWQFLLKAALERCGLGSAINGPLNEEDPINIQAMAMILTTVPDSMQACINNTRIAYQAFDNIKSRYGKLDVTRQIRLENEIRSMKLVKFDSKSVNEHLASVEKQVLHLVTGGSQVNREKHLNLIASTLPGGPEWSVLKDAVAYGDHTVETALEKIRDKCRQMMVSETALVSKTRTSNPNRQKDFDLKLCFFCHEPGHRIRDCSKREASENKKQQKYPSLSRKLWLFDCGATKHFTNTRDGLVNVRSIGESLVELADGSTCSIYEVGDSFVHTCRNPIKLANVHFAPKFDANLMSISELTKDGFQVKFVNNEAIVSKGDEIFMRAKRINNLYKYFEPMESAFKAKTNDWHSRLGHPCISRMRDLKEVLPNLDLNHSLDCLVCQTAKQRQQPYRPSNNHKSRPLELIHADVCNAMGAVQDDDLMLSRR